MNSCPKSAIHMTEDEYGFLYPQINTEPCVGCGACTEVCDYQHLPEKHIVKQVYAAANRNDNLLKQSASGGAFSVFAESVLNQGGVVYGVALPFEDGKLRPKHIRINSRNDLIQLQGSKYVQSRLGFSYQQIRKDLLAEKRLSLPDLPARLRG